MKQTPIPNITQEEIDAAVGVLKSGTYILGPEVENLEKEVAEFYNKNHAIAVGNGTDALFLSLKAMGIGPGDEVITTPFTFVATSEVIANAGATPVFVDINYNDFLINPDLIEAAITKKTKAIMPIHLFGQNCSQRIYAIAKKHKLRVIEDAAQAFGNPHIGLGDALCFSFHPAKCLGCCGDGGMILTDDKELADRIRLLHYHGAQPHDKYNNLMVGYNSRLDAVQAAILRIRLKNFYNQPVKTLLTFRVKDRDFVFEQMKRAGCDVKIFYKTPMYRQPAFQYLGVNPKNFPVCEEACQNVISLNTFKKL